MFKAGLWPTNSQWLLVFVLAITLTSATYSQERSTANDPEETYHNWVMANERTAAALKAKSYDYRYVFSRATKHCDKKVFEHTLADTLVWMWRDYQPE